MKEYLFEINHKMAEKNQSEDWKLKDLERALKIINKVMNMAMSTNYLSMVVEI